MKYIFLDTFAIDQLTKQCYEALSFYLYEQELQLLITPMLLAEYYSPVLQRNDRTERALWLLMEHNFVVANQDILMSEEERAYPAELPTLPIQLQSGSALNHLNEHDQFKLLRMLLHDGIPEAGYNLKDWAERYKVEKETWVQSVEMILANAKNNGTINSKAIFTESLDLRFCKGVLQAVGNLIQPKTHDKIFFERISKFNRINKRHDTRIMKGIHLSSLIMWYDYVVAKKKIKPSDVADIYHAMLYPYCEVVIADVSRIDCIRRIQREDSFCRHVNFYTKSEFKRLLKDTCPEIPALNSL